ncbi:hypothetical protein [Anaeromyxobacter sp. Fw109-5]|uniref:hypothetical protein n=1 Tax=Anaeromyxobacter sp. (strain Fw109-5) TaxID=404589 RepID=UPI0000ED6DCC|nr:hypothetical protein [Anaeromyxobacter sp. Fw109-5]ABS28410.1 hypothetical protein Anae109_4232 [Anaeromyxobacter sp. Fw109-5]
MHATLLTAALLLSVPSRAGDADPRSLVGRPLPEAARGDFAAWKLQDTWLVDEPGAAKGYGWVIWTRRGEAAVFLRKGARVADALRVSVPRGHAIGFACTPAGSAGPDPDVVALVDDPPVPQGARCVFSSPRKAWRLDRSRGRIEPVTPAGMRCQRSCPWD